MKQPQIHTQHSTVERMSHSDARNDHSNESLSHSHLKRISHSRNSHEAPCQCSPQNYLGLYHYRHWSMAYYRSYDTRLNRSSLRLYARRCLQSKWKEIHLSETPAFGKVDRLSNSCHHNA